MSALVLRIKFPAQYPLIYKTLRVDATFNTKQAVRFIADTVNVTSLLVGTEGLYIPDEKRWLDDDAPLSSYDSLQDVEHIEFKDRNAQDAAAATPANTHKNTGGGGGCCVIV